MSRTLYPVLLLSALVYTLPAAAAWKAVLYNKGFEYSLCDSKDSLSELEGAIYKGDTEMQGHMLNGNRCARITKKLDVEVMDQSTLGGWAKVELLDESATGMPPVFTTTESVHKPGQENAVPPEQLDSNQIATPAPAAKDDGHSPIEWPPVGPLTKSGFYPITSGPFVYAKDHPELVKKGMSIFMNPVHTADRGKEATFSGVISGFKKTNALSMAGDTVSHKRCDAFQVNNDKTSWECLSDLKDSDLYYFRTDDPLLTGREVIKHEEVPLTDEELELLD